MCNINIQTRVVTREISELVKSRNLNDPVFNYPRIIINIISNILYLSSSQNLLSLPEFRQKLPNTWWILISMNNIILFPVSMCAIANSYVYKVSQIHSTNSSNHVLFIIFHLNLFKTSNRTIIPRYNNNLILKYYFEF